MKNPHLGQPQPQFRLPCPKYASRCFLPWLVGQARDTRKSIVLLPTVGLDAPVPCGNAGVPRWTCWDWILSRLMKWPACSRFGGAFHLVQHAVNPVAQIREPLGPAVRGGYPKRPHFEGVHDNQSGATSLISGASASTPARRRPPLDSLRRVPA